MSLRNAALLTIVVLNVTKLSAQNISTVVGNHSAGFSGEGGSATAASINAPSGIAITSSGVMYFCDQANNRVRRVSAGGIISTIAGNGTAGSTGDGGQATAAKLDNPMGVTTDAAGNIYIADYNNAKIRKVNTSGVISTLTGSGAPGYNADGTAGTAATIAKPTGVAVDAAGNIYFAEQNNHIIRKISTSGYLSTFAGNRSPSFSGDGGAATAAGISYPAGLFFDASGNLIIVDNGNGRIRKVSTGGIITTLAGNGSAGFSGDGGAATAASFNNVSGAAYDASGNLLIADQNNYRVRKVTTAGIISTIAGTGSGGYSGDGGAATACTFYRPSGLAVYSGNIYVTDMGNSAIRLIGSTTVSHAPSFTGGISQTLNVCNGTTNAINSLLAISDIDAAQTETWAVVSSPAHGSLTGFTRTATSTGSVVTPTGLSFVSTSGYSGADSFRISVSDGSATASTLVQVTVSPAPVAGTISGVTHICPMIRTTYTSSGASGGTWSTSDASLAYADGTGPGAIFNTGAGIVTISYTVTNACGTSVATKPDTIIALPVMSTITGTSTIAPGTNATFTASVTGGVWASSYGTVATVTSGGVVRGNSAGSAAIFYTLTNTCGSTSAEFDIIVATITSYPNIFSFAGDGTGASGYVADGIIANSRRISGPAGLAKDKNGFIYYAEQNNNIIRKVNKRNGDLITVAGNRSAGYSGDGGAATAATINTPYGIAIDKSGNLYIADHGNARIRKVNTSGIISSVAGTGTIGYTADGGAAAAAAIAQPTGVAVDTAGNIYFAEQNNHRIRKISTTGVLSTVAGNGSASFSGDGGAATAAAISYPAGVWVDAAKNIYIADAGNNRIRKVNTSGVISTIAGNGTSGYSGDGGAATAAKIYNPYGVTTDSVGNVYIADRNNNVIRKVTTAGVITTIAGTGTAGYYGDHSPATGAHLYYPQAILCDSTNLYIADFSNNDVRVIGNVTYNYATPTPVYGTLNLALCRSSGAKRLDTLLSITDVNSSVTDTWYVRRSPLHGILSGFPYSHASTGGALMPSGLFYTPTTGYSGYDTFMVTVANYGDSSFFYGYVAVAAPTTVAAIGGPSVVNIVAPVILTDSTTGGTWSSSNASIASVTNTGILIGVATGSATITYSLINGCGSSMATKAITVGNAVSNPNMYSFAGNGTAGYMNAMFWNSPTGCVSGPAGIAKDNAGNFIFSEVGNQDVNYVNRTSTVFYRLLGPGSGFTPTGLAIDKFGNKFVADYGNAKILKFSASGSSVFAGTGTAGFTADGASATAANIAPSFSIAVDTLGNLYFVESTYNRVRKINATTGILTTVAGNGSASFSGDGGQATAASVSSPTGIWADVFGNIFIADAGNNRIRKVAASGIITTIAGTGSAGFSGDGGAATAAALNNPFGVTTDSVGCIYIADKNNNKVRKVSINGTISTIAGTGTAGYSGDDAPATAAQLSGPQGVMCDGNDLYILDYGNNTIRVIGTIHYAVNPITTLASSFSRNVCSGGTISLDSMSAVSDANVSGMIDVWRQATAPVHGTLGGFPYSLAPSGSSLTTPYGLVYTPTAGYTGADSFSITVGDRFVHATIKFYPNVIAAPTVAAISGATSVAISTPITLTDATSGGVWSCTNTARATVNTSGLVRGITTGADTIKYSVTNTCGTTIALKSITVVAGREEHFGNQPVEVGDIHIYPNPATSVVNIDLPPATSPASITLIDINGRIILQTQTTSLLYQLNVGDLANGTYIIKVATDKQVFSEKIVIR